MVVSFWRGVVESQAYLMHEEKRSGDSESQNFK